MRLLAGSFVLPDDLGTDSGPVRRLPDLHRGPGSGSWRVRPGLQPPDQTPPDPAAGLAWFGRFGSAMSRNSWDRVAEPDPDQCDVSLYLATVRRSGRGPCDASPGFSHSGMTALIWWRRSQPQVAAAECPLSVSSAPGANARPGGAWAGGLDLAEQRDLGR